MSSYSDFCSFCNKIECEYLLNEPLSSYTSFKIGGNASVMVFPDCQSKLIDVIRYVRKGNLPLLVLGKGSNILVSDCGFDGIVINTSKLNQIELVDETTIVCQAGVSLARLCKFALENSLTGLEFAYGIPGTAGGAAYMNAGAYGGEMKDVLVECSHINPDGSLGYFKGEELSLGYRHSAYCDSELVIFTLKLKLQRGNPDAIKAKMDELMGKRKDKQPLEYPSAGSTFKRPEGYFAGALLEQHGLKGATVGAAQVSEKHAGFIINKGGATAEDVKNLIELCQKTIYEKTGVMLEPEVKII